jgi:hypothetical protein
VGVLSIRSIFSVFPSDLPGVNPATLNEMILYCRLMTKWSGLGDSTELSRMGLSHIFSFRDFTSNFLTKQGSQKNARPRGNRQRTAAWAPWVGRTGPASLPRFAS